MKRTCGRRVEARNPTNSLRDCQWRCWKRRVPAGMRYWAVGPYTTGPHRETTEYRETYPRWQAGQHSVFDGNGETALRPGSSGRRRDVSAEEPVSALLCFKYWSRRTDVAGVRTLHDGLSLYTAAASVCPTGTHAPLTPSICRRVSNRSTSLRRKFTNVLSYLVRLQ